MARPTDDLYLRIETPAGRTWRHWRITMPRASVAATIRSRILAACGDSVDVLAQRLLAADEAVQGAAEMRIWEPGKDATEDALRLLRNAQAGRVIRGLGGSEVERLATVNAIGEEVTRPRHIAGMAAAAAALQAVVVWALKSRGLALSSESLIGTVQGGRIERPGLLWELAFASDLRFCGDSHGASGDSEELIIAAESGDIRQWVDAIDDFLLSPAEIEVLWAFCLVHTFRPF